jgi:hypothetical protein
MSENQSIDNIISEDSRQQYFKLCKKHQRHPSTFLQVMMDYYDWGEETGKYDKFLQTLLAQV